MSAAVSSVSARPNPRPLLRGDAWSPAQSRLVKTNLRFGDFLRSGDVFARQSRKSGLVRYASAALEAVSVRTETVGRLVGRTLGMFGCEAIHDPLQLGRALAKLDHAALREAHEAPDRLDEVVAARLLRRNRFGTPLQHNQARQRTVAKLLGERLESALRT
jgi:hypothetical protein